MKKKKLTLVEVLIVCAIISRLASLLFPSLRRVRYTSKLSDCANKFKSWGQFLHIYADDHNYLFSDGVSS